MIDPDAFLFILQCTVVMLFGIWCFRTIFGGE